MMRSVGAVAYGGGDDGDDQPVAGGDDGGGDYPWMTSSRDSHWNCWY